MTDWGQGTVLDLRGTVLERADRRWALGNLGESLVEWYPVVVCVAGGGRQSHLQ